MQNIFFLIVAGCMLIILPSLFVQLTYTNYYKIVKLLKSFTIITVDATCFGLHKPSSGSYSMCFAKITMLISITYVVTGLNKICSHNTDNFK